MRLQTRLDTVRTRDQLDLPQIPPAVAKLVEKQLGSPRETEHAKQ
jgi:hypothetical protein